MLDNHLQSILQYFIPGTEGQYCPLILTFLLHFVSAVNKKERQMHFCVD